jgi:hypothetical protein
MEKLGTNLMLTTFNIDANVISLAPPDGNRMLVVVNIF